MSRHQLIEPLLRWGPARSRRRNRRRRVKPTDLAFIDKCVADREGETLNPTALRKCCICMQEIVEDNWPFTVSGLEGAYPPRT